MCHKAYQYLAFFVWGVAAAIGPLEPFQATVVVVARVALSDLKPWLSRDLTVWPLI
jgi:hypothetical protein